VIAAARALFAVAVLVGFYVFTGLLVLFYVALALLGMWTQAQPGVTFSTMPALLAAGALPVIVGLVTGVARASVASGPVPGTRALSRERAPELWDVVEELARLVGSPAPTEIRLTAEANASVEEESRLLGLLVVERRLYLGVPLLVAMRKDELRAVLCHELGHFSHRHTRFGALTYRGALALETAREAMARSMAVNGLARMYGGLALGLVSLFAAAHHRISFAVRRRQEYEADLAAAGVAGPATAGSALVSVHVIAVVWAEFERDLLAPMREAGVVPDDPYRAFAAIVEDPAHHDALAALRADLPQPPRSALDTHPPLSERLALLNGRPDVAVPRDPAPAREWVPDRGEPPDPRAVPWREWLAAVAEHRASGLARELAGAADRVRGPRRDRPVDLRVVLDLLEDGRGDVLDELLGDTPLPAALCAAAGRDLVAAGSAVWTAPWDGTHWFTVHDTGPVEPRELVIAAASGPSQVPRLRLHLLALNVAGARPLATARRGRPERVVLAPDPDLADAQRSSRNASLWTLGLLVAVTVVLFATSGSDEPTSPFPGVRVTYAPYTGVVLPPGYFPLTPAHTYDWGSYLDRTLPTFEHPYPTVDLSPIIPVPAGP
jgi:Zn-dependent protease with chaperone function